MTESIWYPEREPKYDEAGTFEAAIFAADRPGNAGTGGKSYAVFAIRKGGEEPFAGGLFPSQGASEEYRAYIAAAVAVVEALPAGSRVEIATHNPQIKTTLNEWLPKWKANGWKKSDRSEPKALEIIKRYDSVVIERSIQAEAKYVPESATGLGSIFSKLSEQIDRYRAANE